MLGELGAVAFAHDFKAVRVPDFVCKPDNLPPQILGLFGVCGGDDLAADVVRAEQSGFFRHHVVLGGGVAYAADFKSGGIPLAEHVFAYGAFLVRGVSPKVEIFEFLLAAAGGLKVG